jgi:hypothetical protein
MYCTPRGCAGRSSSTTSLDLGALSKTLNAAFSSGGSPGALPAKLLALLVRKPPTRTRLWTREALLLPSSRTCKSSWAFLTSQGQLVQELACRTRLHTLGCARVAGVWETLCSAGSAGLDVQAEVGSSNTSPRWFLVGADKGLWQALVQATSTVPGNSQQQAEAGAVQWQRRDDERHKAATGVQSTTTRDSCEISMHLVWQ